MIELRKLVLVTVLYSGLTLRLIVIKLVILIISKINFYQKLENLKKMKKEINLLAMIWSSNFRCAKL